MANRPAPSFATEAEAFEWLFGMVDDPCIDNERFAYLDDDAALAKYDEAILHGCCGQDDYEVVVNGRPATIGCNSGH